MRKEIKKKLTLSKETVTNLEAGVLANVAGGLRTQREDATCWSCPNTR